MTNGPASVPHYRESSMGMMRSGCCSHLAVATAREKLVLSYPRLDPATSRPRIPSFLLLEHAGATNFKALEDKIRDAQVGCRSRWCAMWRSR